MVLLSVLNILLSCVLILLTIYLAARIQESVRQTSDASQDKTRSMVLETLNQHQQVIELLANQMMALNHTIDINLNHFRESLDQKVTTLQTDTATKLDKIRETVQEKLETTLEKRLSETYKLMSDRLEAVHKGLGEMQSLAQGVGDLRRVLTNVKTRGTWGEIQLGVLLDHVMTPDQYAKNIKILPTQSDHIEFAIKLPGQSANETVWLPIDSKFPQDDFDRLNTAMDSGTKADIESSRKQLEITLKSQAKLIALKYIHPPYSTDFAIMFLPTEGLFSEALRIDGLHDHLQTQYRVIIAGPTTLTAIMSSLQLGFKTLAIQKRTGEVWQLLTLIQNEFGKFGTLLEKTQKKLHEAGQTIEDATRKSRTIERRLDRLSTQYESTSLEFSTDQLIETTKETNP